MKLKKLRTIKPPLNLLEKIEEEIRKLFKREIYKPLIKVLGAPDSTIKNSISSLIEAINSGQIQYVNGHFEGRFNSSIVKELRKLGAQWNRRHGWFSVPQSKLPVDIKSAIATSYSKFQQMSQRLQSHLDKIVPEEIAQKLSIDSLIDKTIYKVNDEFEDNIKNISIAPKLTKEQVIRIRDEYTQNMQLYITDFAEKEIINLRKTVQERTMQGFRYEGMVKSIQESYGVSKSKAKFLARQETNLMTTKLQQTRYQDAGVNNYEWRCVAGSPLHPVRPMHKQLNGKIFSWDNPPIVDEKGSRKNPGQDYNCRCYAVPVIKLP